MKYCNEFPITSNYKAHIIGGRPGGIDYATPIGTPLRLFEGGLVRKSVDQFGGIYIYVTVENRMWLYVHLSRYKDIKTGNLKDGEFFGYSGNTGWSTGAHTHVELRINGKRVDPQPYIDKLLQEPMKKYRS
jgi:murein DD-endopeptidase MepM/ murein hydrolase activator NlpD